MVTLTTLDRLRAYLGIEAGADDVRLFKSLESASAAIQNAAGRHFVPVQATRPHTVNPERPAELLLQGDLLELTGLQNGDGRTIPLADVTLIREGDGAASALLLKHGRAFTWVDHPEQAVLATGFWGWHDAWSSAWRDSKDFLVGSVDSATVTEILVGFADHADAAAESPRFQVGQMLRIDSEYLHVLDIVVDTEGADTLTVRRGINGTTATTHSLNTPIDSYQPPEIITSVTVLWAAWLYRTPDHQHTEAIPTVLTDLLTSLVRRTVNGL